MVPIKLKTFIELTMDIASTSPRRYFFEASPLSLFQFFSFCHHGVQWLQQFKLGGWLEQYFGYSCNFPNIETEVNGNVVNVAMNFENEKENNKVQVQVITYYQRSQVKLRHFSS